MSSKFEIYDELQHISERIMVARDKFKDFQYNQSLIIIEGNISNLIKVYEQIIKIRLDELYKKR
jgi:hypothetical protein